MGTYPDASQDSLRERVTFRRQKQFRIGELAGTTGLEPATSAVTVLLAMMARVGRSEPKLHDRKHLVHFASKPSVLTLHVLT
jgi:hypothetical protein